MADMAFSLQTDNKPNGEKQLPRTIPVGKYVSQESDDEMTVTKMNVRIRRRMSTWATLDNNLSGEKLYDIFDLAKSHPMRLMLLDENRVEFVREESPPYPEIRFTFIRNRL